MAWLIPAQQLLGPVMLPLFLLAAEPAQPEADRLFVRFSAGRLTVRAQEVPLTELAQEIRKESGVVVDLKDSNAAQTRLTLGVTDRDLERALEEILRGFSFVFVYERARLVRVTVLSPAGSPSRLSPERSRGDSAPDFERLLEQNQEEGLKAISAALLGGDVMTKLLALEALRGVEGQQALALLREALANPDLEVKESALEILVRQTGPEVVPTLSAALGDPDPSFRIQILEALAEKGRFQPVKRALSDSNGAVRQKAAELLEGEDE